MKPSFQALRAMVIAMEEQARVTARRLHESPAEVEIDEGAPVEESDDGFYVQAWVYVDNDEVSRSFPSTVAAQAAIERDECVLLVGTGGRAIRAPIIPEACVKAEWFEAG